MKRVLGIVLAIVAIISCPIVAEAQGHNAALTWTAPTDAVTGTTYNIYRAPNACPATVTPGTPWVQIKTAWTATSFTDSTIGVGSWCYYITQVQSATESKPSPDAGGVAAPNTVTIFTVVVT